MKPIFLIGAAALLLAGASSATLAQDPPPAAPAAAARSHLAVFIRPGPAWERRGDHVAALIEHRDLYRLLNERGDIAVSGPFEGEPVLGLALFAAGADEADIRRRLDSDPAIALGLLVNEYRRFAVHFGGLPPPR